MHDLWKTFTWIRRRVATALICSCFKQLPGFYGCKCGWMGGSFHVVKQLVCYLQRQMEMSPLAFLSKIPAHMFSSRPNTHTVVSCMQEVKQLFRTVLFCVGSGADASFTQLQALLGMHTVFRLLTFCPYCVQRVLWDKKQMQIISENGDILPAWMQNVSKKRDLGSRGTYQKCWSAK